MKKHVAYNSCKLLVLIMLAVIMAFSSISASACIDHSLLDQDLKDMKFEDYFATGYSWENFLNGYNYVVFGDDSVDKDLESTVHCMGAVLVDGDVYFQWNGGFSDSGQGDLPVPPPSFVSGEVLGGTYNQRGGKSFPLYMGTSDISGINKNGNADVYYSPEFLDFDKAYKSINSASEMFKQMSTGVVHAFGYSNMYPVEFGSSVTIHASEFNGYPIIWLYGSNPSAMTVINIVPKADGTIEMPEVRVSGSLLEPPQQFQLQGGEATDVGCSVIWNMPDAKKVKLSSSASVGHFFAQNAYVNAQSSNINGTVICQTYKGGAEGHLYAFKGSSSVVFSAGKTVVGKANPNDTFEFRLVGEAGAPMPAKNRITLKGDESGVFGPVNFTTADIGKTFSYKMYENAGTGNYIYDKSVYTITVEVVASPGGRAAVKTIITRTLDGVKTNVNSVRFVNTVKGQQEIITPASLSIPVTKVIDGAAPAGSKFTFKLAGKDGAPMPAMDTVQVTVGAEGRGSNAFGSISYNEAGTYSYTVTELVDSDASTEGGTAYKVFRVGDDDYKVVYDTNVYSVDVKVEKNGTALVASASCKKNGAAASSIEFTNKVTKEEKEEERLGAKLLLRKVDAKTGEGLLGAVYGLYNKASCTDKDLVLVLSSTDADGYSQVVDVEPGDYWVREIKPPKKYGLDYEPYKVTVVAGQTALALVKNTFGEYDLTITKEVLKSGTRQQFSMKLVLEANEGVDCTGIYVKVHRNGGTEVIDRLYSGDLHDDGVLSFKLAHGDTLTVAAIPDGVSYRIGEFKDGDCITYFNGEKGNSAAGTMDMSKDITISNVYAGSVSNVPDTGDHSPLVLWAGMLVIALVGMFILIRKRETE